VWQVKRRDELLAEVDALRDRARDAEAVAATLVTALEKEQHGRADDALKARQRMAWRLAREAAEKLALEAALEAQLRQLGVENDSLRLQEMTTRYKLGAQIKHLDSGVEGLKREKDKQIDSLRGQLGRTEAEKEASLNALRSEKEAEGGELKGKIDLLAGKVEALRASKSARRSMLYWSGMQVTGRITERGTPRRTKLRSGPRTTGSPERIDAVASSLELANPVEWRKPERFPRTDPGGPPVQLEKTLRKTSKPRVEMKYAL